MVAGPAIVVVVAVSGPHGVVPRQVQEFEYELEALPMAVVVVVRGGHTL